MNDDAWERVPMERIHYEPGEDEPRFVVLVVNRWGRQDPRERPVDKAGKNVGKAVNELKEVAASIVSVARGRCSA